VVKVELETRPGASILAELPHGEFRALGLRPGDPVHVGVRAAQVFEEDYAI
jgi:hypothetical protein